MPSLKLRICILAAGSSTRLGTPKQLVLFRGEPLLRYIVQTALGVPQASVIVVVHSQKPQVAAVLSDLPIRLAFNPDPDRGMGTSIKVALDDRLGPAPDGYLFVLGDQPYVDIRHLRGLQSAWQGSPLSVVASIYPSSGDWGVPCLFPRHLRTRLEALKDDQGAKGLITQCRPRLGIPLPEDAAFDLDTPDDLVALRLREFLGELAPQETPAK